MRDRKDLNVRDFTLLLVLLLQVCSLMILRFSLVGSVQLKHETAVAEARKIATSMMAQEGLSESLNYCCFLRVENISSFFGVSFSRIFSILLPTYGSYFDFKCIQGLCRHCSSFEFAQRSDGLMARAWWEHVQDLDDATVRENFFLDGVGLSASDSKAGSANAPKIIPKVWHFTLHLHAVAQLFVNSAGQGWAGSYSNVLNAIHRCHTQFDRVTQECMVLLPLKNL